jgi:hypothetical protein
VAFVSIGENSRLAFNDPPADFETGRPISWCVSTPPPNGSWADGSPPGGDDASADLDVIPDPHVA